MLLKKKTMVSGIYFRVYVIIGLVSYLPKVGGSVVSFIVSLALACSKLSGTANFRQTL
jgi:hypothetical protein